MPRCYDYKVKVNFESSAHGQRKYLTDKEILEETINLMRSYLSGVKKSKYFKIERNYSIAKWAKEHKKKYGRKTT